MAQTPTSKSAPINNAAKDDVVGLNGDYSFTLADLLANDPGGAAKVATATQFFFGNTTDYVGIDFAHGGLPSIEQQKAYLLSHNIVSNDAFTEFTIGVGGTDFEYMVQIGNKGTWSQADVHVTAPEPTKGDLLFVENFDHYQISNDHGTWGEVNLTAGSAMQPNDQIRYWANSDGNGGWLSANAEIVRGDLGGGNIASTSGDYWLDTQNSPGAIDLFNSFKDPTGDHFVFSFDIGIHDFGDGKLQETAHDASFEVRVDGVAIGVISYDDLLNKGNGQTDIMHHYEFVGGHAGDAAGDHLIELVDTTGSTGNYVGFAVDSIQIHDWFV